MTAPLGPIASENMRTSRTVVKDDLDHESLGPSLRSTERLDRQAIMTALKLEDEVVR